MQELNLPLQKYNIKEENGKQLIFDSFRKNWVALTPEEWVRQNFLMWLVTGLDYPAGRIAVETSLLYNNMKKRADAVVYDQNGQSLVLIECKAPQVQITQKTFEQAASYNFRFQTRYLMLTNGLSHYCCHIDLQRGSISFLENIPVYNGL
jgi:hypothetical protein